MGGRRTPQATGSRARAALRRFALAFPGAHEDFPWGESVIKVGKKVFVFLGRPGESLGLSVKLPHSNLLALDLSFTSPTGYGLAKGGWVTARFGPRDEPPLNLLRRWVEESYRAVAPRRMVAAVDAHRTPSNPAARRPDPVKGPRRRRGRRS